MECQDLSRNFYSQDDSQVLAVAVAADGTMETPDSAFADGDCKEAQGHPGEDNTLMYTCAVYLHTIFQLGYRSWLATLDLSLSEVLVALRCLAQNLSLLPRIARFPGILLSPSKSTTTCTGSVFRHPARWFPSPHLDHSAPCLKTNKTQNNIKKSLYT